MKKLTLNDMPTEVVTSLLEYLPGASIYALSKTSKRFYSEVIGYLRYSHRFFDSQDPRRTLSPKEVIEAFEAKYKLAKYQQSYSCRFMKSYLPKAIEQHLSLVILYHAGVYISKMVSSNPADKEFKKLSMVSMGLYIFHRLLKNHTKELQKMEKKSVTIKDGKRDAALKRQGLQTLLNP